MRGAAAEPEISFVMPARNEAATVGTTVQECLETLREEGVAGEIVVADDGSSDGTAETLDALVEEVPGLVVLHRTGPPGYGAALREAIAASRGRYVVTLDSDGQFDPREARGLLALLRAGAACATGYRARKADEGFRVWGHRVYAVLARRMAHLPYRDVQCALKGVQGDLLRGLPLESEGFMLPTEILFRIHHGGHRIVETAVSHRPRRAGRSSLAARRTAIRMLLYLVRLRWRLAWSRAGAPQRG